MSSEKCSLIWEDFLENVSETFQGFRNDTDFTDVTLVCEDNIQIEAHKVVLASSSPLISKILKSRQHTHPLIYLWGVKARDLKSIVEFIYSGEVEVYKTDLNDFIQIGNKMGIKGIKWPENESQQIKEEIRKIDKEGKIDSDFTSLVKDTLTIPQELTKHATTKIPNDINIPFATKLNPPIVENNTRYSSTFDGLIEQGTHAAMFGYEESLQKNRTYSKQTSHPDLEEQSENNFSLQTNSQLERPKSVKRYKKRQKRKRTNIWNYFNEDTFDAALVHCNLCSKVIRRGKSGTQIGRMSGSAMLTHLKNMHSAEWVIVECAKVKPTQSLKSRPIMYNNKTDNVHQQGIQNKLLNFFEVSLVSPMVAVCQVGDCMVEVHQDLEGTWSNQVLKEHLVIHDYNEED